VFAARYELNSYIVFRKRLVSKRLKKIFTSSVRDSTRETEHNSIRDFGAEVSQGTNRSEQSTSTVFALLLPRVRMKVMIELCMCGFMITEADKRN
jgi:hypothetical protein